MNLKELAYVEKKGSIDTHDIVVYALSTCGFCKRALSFLDEKGFSYKYIHVDQLPLETKNEIKKILKERFNENVAFPFAVIDDESHLVGFIQPDWVRTLGLTGEK
ncbi:MAG TPA: glutaredoxin [Spirochaetaceae bacterium]|nr:glutaredoxin [Spirochaetaceae bacterium]